jgi:L-aminopeptidase/D-esterase-like protein
MRLVDKVHALLLAGGSAFGLDAAGGVVRYLEERGVGFDVGVARVPIVPAAILFDLALGRADVRPDATMGYQACLNASANPPAEGCVGAGMGATVGKALGMGGATKAGIGTATLEIANGLLVGAIAAVNAFGDVVDPASGKILAGTRSPETGEYVDTLNVLQMLAGGALKFGGPTNTVIGVVVTNARLTKEETNKLAQMAQDGLARAVRPAHTMLDGDTIFALATGEQPADINVVGAFGAQVFAQAVVRAVTQARPLGGLPAANEEHHG